MAPLKAFLTQLQAKVEYVARGGDPRLLEGCLNIVLTGNPGAGKTTAARLLFRALRAYGLLRKNVFVERNALELKGTHIGWTCPQARLPSATRATRHAHQTPRALDATRARRHARETPRTLDATRARRHAPDALADYEAPPPRRGCR